MFKKLILVFLLAAAAFAADIDSRIVRVTVYPGLALVERHASLKLEPGANQLSITGLPAALVEESVYARLTSGKEAALEEVNVEKWFLAKSEEGAVRKLEEEILDLERQDKKLEGEIKSLSAQEKFLQSIQATAATATGQTAALIKPDAVSWNSTVAFIGTGLNKVYSEMSAHEFERRELKEQKDALEKQLAAAQSAKPREDKSIEMTIRAAGATTAQITVAYLVTDASWWPTYEIRALPQEGKIEIVYSGQVRQKSGEDWPNAELSLSTALPARGATVPELQPWNLRLWVENRMALYKAGRAAMAAMAIQSDKAEMEMPAPAPAAVENKSTSVLFAIPGQRDVASGEEPTKVLIAQNTFPAQMNYIAVPKLSPSVYLQGKFSNASLYPLLSGAAMIYVDGDYVGKTQLKSLAPGESVDLSLGIDEGLKVKRELVKKFERNKGTLSKKHEMEYDYKIVVENFKKQAVQLKIADQLPRPQQEEIELGDIKLTPEPGEWDKEKQSLIWPLDLKPGEKKELLIHFTVSYPRDGQVIGLE